MSDDPQQTQSAPPRLQDLPAAWTILECVAWIAFRDTAVMRDAAAETERPAGTFATQVQASDGSLEAASVAGEAGYSPIRLSLEWAYRNATKEAPLGPAPNEARQDLLTKLRASRLTARGTPSDGTGQRAMTAADWRGLVFVTRDRILQAEPDRFTGQVWRDVTMARDDVVREWPQLASPSAGSNSDADAPFRWMREHMDAPRAMKRADAIADCRRVTGCLHKTALAAWNALPKYIRSGSGRPKQ